MKTLSYLVQILVAIWHEMLLLFWDGGPDGLHCNNIFNWQLNRALTGELDGKLCIAVPPVCCVVICMCRMFIYQRVLRRIHGLYKGRLEHLPPKFEHIFVAVITFPPFLLCRYFYYQLVAYCVCFKMICEMSL